MSEYKVIINENGNIAVDDNILVKGYPTEAGSKILQGFTPLFSATAVERLESNGYVISGKTKVGEFGLDLLGETANDDACLSSGAKLVKEGKVKACLSVDVNGYPRRSAKEMGVKFIKPTYGTVSRYGIIPCVCSAEQVGVTANTTDDLISILSIISGHDEKDGTSLKEEKYCYKAEEKAFKVAVIKELKTKEVEEVISSLISEGVVVAEVSFDEIKKVAHAWQILMSAETCNNLSRYDGVKYGYRTENYNDIEELYVNTRTEGFGVLAKSTILYGSSVLSKDKYLDCYDKSLRIRRFTVEKVTEFLKEFDALLLGVSSNTAIENEKVISTYEQGIYTCLASITGLPAIVTNGVSFVADYNKENLLFGLSKLLEK